MNKEEKKLNKKINLNRIERMLSRQISLMDNEKKMLEKIKEHYKTGRYEEGSNALMAYESLTEKNFLERKSLRVFAPDIERKINVTSAENDAATLGKTDFFSSKLTVDASGNITMILPKIERRNWSDRRSHAGDFVAGIVSLLVKNAYADHVIESAITHAAVIFEHHLDMKISENIQADADNLETKKILDMINGKLIPNDSLLDIDLYHLSVPDKKVYTKLHIIPQENIISWLLENREIVSEKWKHM